MISHRPHRLVLRGVVLGLWLVSFVAPRLGVAQCTYTGLTSGVSITTGTADSDLQFSEGQPYWSVLGVRPDASTADWDTYVYSSAIGYPFCLNGLLASSTQGVGVADLVVGDFNSNPTGTYYGQAHHYSSDNVTSTVEWVAGSQIMHVNGPMSFTTMGGSEVARIWDVFLNQGQAYHFTHESFGNSKLLLFRNPANAPFWTGRSGALFSLASSTAGLDFTAPASDWYGLVLVNDGSSDFIYVMGVGTCSPVTALPSRSTQQDPDAISYYQFTPPNALWTAVVTRPDATPAGEQDLALYGATGGTAPNCFTDWQDESDHGSGECNILAGYSDPGPPETWYFKTQYGINGTSAVGSHTEWDGDGRIMYVDDLWPTQGSMTNNDLIDCYNVWLQAGVPVTLNYTISIGSIAPRVFENPGSGSHWVNDADVLTPVNGVISPQTTGWHAVVVSHDRNDGGGTYTLTLQGCPTPVTLANHVSVRTPDPAGYYSFDQEDEYWTVVGTHAVTPLVDWDLSAFQNPQGGAPPSCFGGLLTTSQTGAATTDLVVGDFNLLGNSLGTYYTHPYRYSGESDSWTEWDSGADQINVGDPFTHTVLSDSDFVRCWDVFLGAGQKYTIEFQHDAGIDAKVLLFQSSNAPYWAGRTSAALQSAGTTTFTAPATDFYGVVVVNDRGSGGTDLRILPPNVAVGAPGVPSVTALKDAGPNPSRGPLTLAFDLAEPATVDFQLLDVTGRVVAARATETHGAGSWSESWDPFGRQRGGAGIYFLRMRAGEREVSTIKIARLD
ncbi:MAG: T9SS type A sorting domain-containing protein [Candidatus Eisenbacteria bacterium]